MILLHHNLSIHLHLALTARKPVRPLSSHRLALRFVHRSLARTLRRSEDFRRWRSAPLSTPYPLTTSESSLGSSSERSLDSSSPSSRPSCKRCRSLTASAPSLTHVLRLITPTPADLLPPYKRFRDSYLSEDSGEEYMEVDTIDAEANADVAISEGVVAHPEDSIDMGVEIAASDVREDDEEFEAEASTTDTREIDLDPLAIGDSSLSSRGVIPDLEDTIYDTVHYMSEVRIDKINEIDTTQIQLETSQLVASGERASLVKRIGSLRLEYLTNMTITHSATRVANALEAENQSQNGSDGDNGNGRNGNGRDGNGGNRNGGDGNGRNGNGGNGNPNENNRDARPVAQEFKYAIWTLLNSELTRWNSHKRTIGAEDAFVMSWRELMKLMAE
ncbi:hypothetical protein Tco_1298587, partial [Tanacetum coccineum]